MNTPNFGTQNLDPSPAFKRVPSFEQLNTADDPATPLFARKLSDAFTFEDPNLNHIKSDDVADT